MLYILYQTQLDELQSAGSVSRPPHISVYAAEVIHRPVRRPVGRLAYDDVDYTDNYSLDIAIRL